MGKKSLRNVLLYTCFIFLRNPIGRTGIRGRGVLKRFGPNHIIEMIITRYCFL